MVLRAEVGNEEPGYPEQNGVGEVADSEARWGGDCGVHLDEVPVFE